MSTEKCFVLHNNAKLFLAHVNFLIRKNIFIDFYYINLNRIDNISINIYVCLLKYYSDTISYIQQPNLS